MGGTKLLRTPKSGKKSAKKRARTGPVSPAVQQGPPVSELPESPKTPVQKRRRASEFASKKSSSKKRERSQATSGKASVKKEAKESAKTSKDDETSVDEVLQQVRELMKSKSTSAKAKALAEALKRADEIFENDISGSSSTDEDDRVKASDDERPPSRNTPGKKSKNVSEARPGKTPERQNKDANSTSVKTPRRQKASDDLHEIDKRVKTPRSSRKRKAEGIDDELDPGKHKAEIEALKKDDPSFYKFLEENDGSLLDFDMSDDSDLEGAQQTNGDLGNGVQGGDLEDSERHNSSDDEEDAVESGSPESSEAEGSEDEEHVPTRKEVGSPRSDREKQMSGTLKDAKPIEDVKGSESEDVTTSEDSESNDDDSSGIGEEPEKKRVVQPREVIGKSDAAKREAETDEVTGYSDDEDDDSISAAAEAEAAAEAGLAVQNSSDSDASIEEPKEAKSRKRKMVLVDMKYLRELKELLKSKRSSLKACKDLLRLLRAGREILPTSPISKDKKIKQAMSAKRAKKSSQQTENQELNVGDDDVDVYKDDGSFTSGKVKFASSRSYQQAMNLAIIGIQDALDRMLGRPRPEDNAIESLEMTWDPKESSRWVNLEPIFRPYVFHMLALCDATEDAATLRFLLRRLEKLVPYTRENQVLVKKLCKVALDVWSADSRHIGQTTRLRAYVLLTRLAHGPGNTETVLRASCNAFTSKVGNVCNSKTLPLIQFTTSCLVELFGIDMGASYTTAFSYLRELAVSLRAVLVAKDRKEEVERIHNWSFINQLRLFSKILGRYGSEEELRPLIYPYVQISIGVMRAYPTPRTIPLRFHVASYLSDLTSDTGVFIPVVPQLLSILRCSELRKKSVHGTSSALDWRSLLRVSDEVVKTKPFLTGLINGVVYNIGKYFAIMSKHVSFPEVSHFAEVTLKRLAKEVLEVEWRTSLKSLAHKIHETSSIICETRSKADFSPHGAIHSDGMLAMVPGIDEERKMPIKRLFDVEHARMMKEERMRDEKRGEKRSKDEGIVDDVSSESEEDTATAKRRKVGKGVKREKSVMLSAAVKIGSDDEEDEIAELSLDSD